MSVRRCLASILMGGGVLTLTGGSIPLAATPTAATPLAGTSPRPGATLLAGASPLTPTHPDAAEILAPTTTVAQEPAPAPARSATVSHTGRVIVKMSTPADVDGESQVRRTAAAAGTAIGAARPTATGGTVVAVDGDPVAAARTLAAQPGVAYAVPERRLQPATDPNDPGYPSQWDLPAIHVPDAWPYSRGAGVTVAVIDTGSLPHPDLQGQYLPGYDFVGDPTYSLDGDGRDSDATDAGDWTPYGVCDDPTAHSSSWHGAHVAGTIAALAGNGAGIAGIASAARILPVRALGRCGGTDSDITDALVWAAGGRVPGVPANPNPAKIINLSLSGPGSCSPVEQDAIDQATALGALVVVAAGNDGADVAGYTPANCRGVLAVAATGVGAVAAPYSNSGSAVALSAPGSGITSLGNRGTRAYDPAGWTTVARSGTSMATPHVSAVAALVWSLAPSRTAAEIRRVLTATVTRFPTTTYGFGAGIINAGAAVNAVRPSNVAPPTITRVDPAAARTGGGDLITITGSGLSGATVTIGGRIAAVSSATATALVVAAPAGSVGTTQLAVTTAGGTASVAFRYDTRYPVRRGGGSFTPRP